VALNARHGGSSDGVMRLVNIVAALLVCVVVIVRRGRLT
jgi:hypothetical protein